MTEDEKPTDAEQPSAESEPVTPAEAPAADAPVAEVPAAEAQAPAEAAPAAEETAGPEAVATEPAAEEPAAEAPVAEPVAEAPAAEPASAAVPETPAAEAPAAPAPAAPRQPAPLPQGPIAASVAQTIAANIANPSRRFDQPRPAAPGGGGFGDRGPGGGRGGFGGGRGRGGPAPWQQQDDGIKPEFQEKVVHLNRVAKVVKGGRRFSFSALVVVGDQKGRVGAGLGKAGEVPDAIRKGVEDAKKNLINVPLDGSTIPHELRHKLGAAKIMLKPASPGTGVIAGGAMRAVVELAGIKDILGKSLGTNNPINTTRATIDALRQLRTAEQVAAARGVGLSQLGHRGTKPAEPVAAETAAPAGAPA